MGAKDNWMNTTTEALDNILHIKFNSWIDWFINHINKAWVVEEDWLRQRFNLGTINFGISNATQPIIALATFLVAVKWVGHDVTLGKGVAGL